MVATVCPIWGWLVMEDVMIELDYLMVIKVVLGRRKNPELTLKATSSMPPVAQSVSSGLQLGLK